MEARRDNPGRDPVTESSEESERGIAPAHLIGGVRENLTPLRARTGLISMLYRLVRYRPHRRIGF